MGENIKQIYLNLNNLLEDICKFLSGEKLNFLSPAEKEVANTLISRSKRQLQEISKIVPKLNEEDYVDMTKNYSAANDTDSHSANSNVDKPPIPEKRIVPENKCPYTALKAENVSHEVKCGNLWMRKKLILNIEVLKKVFASIHDNWLLVYSSNVDSKPLCFYDLKYYKAREESVDRNSRIFELIDSQCPEKKVCQFSTKAYKDMIQWVYKINGCYNGEEPSKDDESYDIIEPNLDLPGDEEENIYNEPEMVCHRQPSCQTIVNTTKPPLPGRKPTNNVPPPPSPDSVHSEVSYHEVIEIKPKERMLEVKDDTEQSYYEPEIVSKTPDIRNDDSCCQYESVNAQECEKVDRNILKITRKSLFSEWQQRSLETFSPKSSLRTFQINKPSIKMYTTNN
ncbi:uncharacterized protein LOC132695595 isoform X2 [Cylas formicarius]|nr:uncharacterized protein LOC132695595 isoform X2 [Cylas formicarius]